jgi:hydroxymethylpyrimidine pyrophosphatase-like HAD family hydrolase
MNLNKEGDVVWREWLNPEQVKEIVRKIGGRCVSFSTATLDERINFDPDRILVSQFTYSKESPTLFAVYPLHEKEEIDETLHSIGGVAYELMKYDNSTELGCLQVTRPGIDKGTGVTRMLHEAGLDGKQILAVGDAYEGDSQFFRAVWKMGRRGVCAAVGNADEHLKRIADYCAKASVDDEPSGFTEITGHYGLLAPRNVR